MMDKEESSEFIVRQGEAAQFIVREEVTCDFCPCEECRKYQMDDGKLGFSFSVCSCPCHFVNESNENAYLSAVIHHFKDKIKERLDG
jgi:hypothetical protein